MKGRERGTDEEELKEEEGKGLFNVELGEGRRRIGLASSRDASRTI